MNLDTGTLIKACDSINRQLGTAHPEGMNEHRMFIIFVP